MGATPTSKPKVSAEATDRATCLYETEWQISDAVANVSQQAALSKRRMLLVPHQSLHSRRENSFVWEDTRDPARSVTVLLFFESPE